MGMSGPSMPLLPRMYELMIFFANAIDFILPASIKILVPNVSRWQAYFTYLSPKCHWKDWINKMHEGLILEACFDAWA